MKPQKENLPTVVFFVKNVAIDLIEDTLFCNNYEISCK